MDFADKNLGTKKTTTTAHFKASKSDQKKYTPSGLLRKSNSLDLIKKN